MRRRRIGIIASIVLTVSVYACSSTAPSTTTSAPSTVTPTLHGEVNDPTGDARPYPNVANPPDLVHGTADVVAGNIIFTVLLAPGTFDPATTLLIINLDTDQNPATGQAPDGIDYLISMGDGQGNQALIAKYVAPLSYTTVGSASVGFTADGMTATVPLSLLGGAGKMNFRVTSFIHLPGTQTSSGLDNMPDTGLPLGSIQ
jgi:hypothetical protein